MKITAIAKSKNLTAAKLERLTQLASRLAKETLRDVVHNMGH